MEGVDPVPIAVTLSICGSVKTLEFVARLGVKVLGWIRNELTHSRAPLAESLRTLRRRRPYPLRVLPRLALLFGFNVENVSTRRIENDTDPELVKELRPFVGSTNG